MNTNNIYAYIYIYYTSTYLLNLMFFFSRNLIKLGYDPKKYYFQQCQRNRLTRNIYVLLPFRNRIHKIYKYQEI